MAGYGTAMPGQIGVTFSNRVDVYDAETSTWSVLDHPGACGFRQAVGMSSAGQSLLGWMIKLCLQFRTMFGPILWFTSY